MEWVFAFTVVLGMVVGRTNLVELGRARRYGPLPTNIAILVVAAVATTLSISIVVWGLASLPWYWIAGPLIVGLALAYLIVTLNTWAYWHEIRPTLDLLLIAASAFLWIWWWPW